MRRAAVCSETSLDFQKVKFSHILACSDLQGKKRTKLGAPLFRKNLVHMNNPPNPKRRRPDKLRRTARAAVFFLLELSLLEAVRVKLERLLSRIQCARWH
jgi:hypothetical protein